MKSILTFIILATLLSGCVSKQIEKPLWHPDLKSADFGIYPFDYPRIVLKWGELNFSDPETINHLSMSEPRQEYLITDEDKQTALFGYSVCVDINANRAASHEKPMQKHWFLLHNDTIIKHRIIERMADLKLDYAHQIDCNNPE